MKKLLLSLALLTVLPTIGADPSSPAASSGCRQKKLDPNNNNNAQGEHKHQTGPKSLFDLSMSELTYESFEKIPVSKIAEHMYQLPHIFQQIHAQKIMPYSCSKSEEWEKFIQEQIQALKQNFDQETFDFLNVVVSEIRPYYFEFIKNLAELGTISDQLAEKITRRINPLIVFYYFDELFSKSMLSHNNELKFKKVYSDYCVKNGINRGYLRIADNLKSYVLFAALHASFCEECPYMPATGHRSFTPSFSEYQRLQSLRSLHGDLTQRYYSTLRSGFEEGKIPTPQDIKNKMNNDKLITRALKIAEMELKETESEVKQITAANQRPSEVLLEIPKVCHDLIKTCSEEGIREYFNLDSYNAPAMPVA